MRQKNFDAVMKLAKKYSKNLRKNSKIISIVQIGSSLRKEDFKPNSDLDLLVVYEKSVKRCIELDSTDGIEVNLLQYGKKQFLESAESGTPVDLIALKFGKILYDNGFFASAREKGFAHTEKTAEKWIRTATFNLMDAAMNYPYAACMCCYFKALHHAAREFCRVIILKEQGELVEGDTAVLNRLKPYPDLRRRFRLIINGRKDYEKFEQKFIKYPKIKNSGTGKYLLAAEDIAIAALKVSMNLNVPKVNKLISQLQKRYKIDHYNSFYITPEKKELLLHLILKGDKSGFFIYSLEDRKLKRMIV